MKTKKYLKIIFLMIGIFIGFHFAIWNLLTKKVFEPKDNTNVGDLGKISYLQKSFFLRENKQELSEKHLDYQKNLKVDVLTIGDSFSNGGAGGMNKFYQDYISTNQNLKVMNIQPSLAGFIVTRKVIFLKFYERKINNMNL